MLRGLGLLVFFCVEGVWILAAAAAVAAVVAALAIHSR